MRLRALGNILAPSSRMRLAAAGLAARGHEVQWEGEEDEISNPGEVTSRINEIPIVLGSGVSVLGTAWKGWLAGAHVMALDGSRDQIRRWSWLERWAFGSLQSIAMVAPGEETEANESLHGIGADHFATWSDAPAPASPDPAHPDVEILERRLEHELARREGHAERPAVFLDRDGTLVIERHYLSEAEQIELLPGVSRALARLRAAGYRLIVISNQAGVGRGLFDVGAVYAAMSRLRRDLRKEGVELDAVYFCPHAPDAGCECRKPGTRMLRDAAANQVLSLRRSFVVGDRLLDVATAANAGATGILVRTGYGVSEAATAGNGIPVPEFVADDLAAAAEWITTRGHAGD